MPLNEFKHADHGRKRRALVVDCGRLDLTSYLFMSAGSSASKMDGSRSTF